MRLARIGAQHPQATDKHGHLRRCQRQQLRPVQQQLFRQHVVARLLEIAKAVSDRFERSERRHVGLILRCVHATRRKRNGDCVASVAGGLLHPRATRQHDQVGKRDLLATHQSGIERLADRLQHLEHGTQLLRLVDRPVLLRRESQPRAVGAAPLVGAAEAGRGRPGRRNQLRHRQARRQHFLLEGGDVLLIDQRMVDGGDRVLPDHHFLRHIRAEITGTRPHVAVGELEPGTGEGVGELVGVGQEAPGNLFVGRVDPHRHVGGQHGRRQPLGRVVRVRNGACTGAVLGHPLVGATRALGQFPFEAEQVLEVVVAPLGGRGGPGDFQSTGDGVAALAGAEAVLPAKSLVLQVGRSGLDRNMIRNAGAVGLAEAVAAGDQRDSLFIVHRHAGEGLADVDGCSKRVGLAVRTFGIDVDQAHLHGCQRVLEDAGVLHFAVVVFHQNAMTFDAWRALGVAHVTPQPLGLAAPVHVLVRLPHVLAATGEAEGLEPHAFQRHVARQHHQVGPRQLLAVLLLDRPQQAAGLVEADVVRPAVERREALLAAAGARAAIADAVSAGAVPGQPDEQRPVVAEVRRPPVLRVGHQRREVLLDRCQIEALEGLGVVEGLSHRV